MRVLIVVAVLTLAPYIRESNSHAASKRGEKAYASGRYTAAESEFANAQKLAPSSQGAFNLGTAQVAAGKRAEGSATLAEAMKDPALRADALFNRGNSALAAKAFDYAIRDYTEALRLRPDDAAAKRNLEIALARQSQAQRGASGQQNQNNQQNQNKQQTPSEQGKKEPKAGDIDLEALLRSVQQQEQEELRRMKARAGEAKVGW